LTKLTSGRSESCREICKRYKSNLNLRNGSYYLNWENCRCSICNIFIKWEGIYCPCCGYRLRRRPRAREAAVKCQVKRGMKRIV